MAVKFKKIVNPKLHFFYYYDSILCQNMLANRFQQQKPFEQNAQQAGLIVHLLD
jgi:hypothetical protein